MADRNKIIKFCEELLEAGKFTDKCHNGLQLEGKMEVKRIITGVSLSQKLIKEAIGKKADMILVHHGLFSSALGDPPVIRNYVRNRLKLLLENDINLAGFHLPLDAHPIIGNNISLCRALGVKDLEPYSVGFVGQLIREIDFRDFVKTVNKKLGVKSFTIAAGPKKVKRVVIVSGGASRRIKDALDLGIDTFVTGDIAESTVLVAEEAGVNFINAGHYNTEKLGIKNLGELIAKKFKVEVEFVDVPCEI